MDLEKLKAIFALLEGSDVTSLDWKNGEESLTLKRGNLASPSLAVVPPPPNAASSLAVPASAGSPEPVVAKNVYTVTSPFVGTFYRSASPEAPPFVEPGHSVRKGQVLCIVEAMKLMNEIEAEVPGKILEILAENGQAVEFGEPLFRIEPAGS